MSSEIARAASSHDGGHASGLGPRQYVFIGVVLTVITAIELWISYAPLGALIVPLLLALSAVKFVIVVGFFMHLRFDAPLLTRLFVFGLVLAGALLIALLALFWNDESDIVGGGVEPGEAHATASEGGSSASGGSEGSAGASASGSAAATITVRLGELFVEAPAEAAAGDVTIVVENVGAAIHNLRVIDSDAPTTGLVVAGIAVDERSEDVHARSGQIDPAGSETITANLHEGRYLLICNVPGHYQGGMVAELIVR